MLQRGPRSLDHQSSYLRAQSLASTLSPFLHRLFSVYIYAEMGWLTTMDDIELWYPSSWDSSIQYASVESLDTDPLDSFARVEADRLTQPGDDAITCDPSKELVLRTTHQDAYTAMELPYARYQHSRLVGQRHLFGVSKHWPTWTTSSEDHHGWPQWEASRSDSGYSESVRSGSIGISSDMGSEYGAVSRSPLLASPLTGEERMASDVGGANYKCNFPGCQTKARFRRPCDLRKHQKRHCKAFFCRFPDCAKTSSKGFACIKDRDRHEARHDPAIQCASPGCRRMFSRMDNMVG